MISKYGLYNPENKHYAIVDTETKKTIKTFPHKEWEKALKLHRTLNEFVNALTNLIYVLNSIKSKRV